MEPAAVERKYINNPENIKDKALSEHEKYKGKIEVISRVPLAGKDDLALFYTPGVAEPCREIVKNPELSYTYTRRGNLVAIITDGTAVLGLGDIGGLAGMPVMEGKCCLFKEFAGIDAFPICIKSKNPDEIVRTIELIADSFGGINLEDISAPRCFEIERRLKEKLDIPIFHDDQHGTAIAVGSAVLNALRCMELNIGLHKDISGVKIVINGAGAAGTAIAELLISLGAANIILVDKCGILCRDNEYDNPSHNRMKYKTNPALIAGTLGDALRGADIFIGVSLPGLISEDMIKSMAEYPVIFAMANPEPEIYPDKAFSAGAYIVGTGRSDYPNQINNLLVFPGVFKGALSVRAREITERMKLSAVYAIAGMIEDYEINPQYIIPDPLDKRVTAGVASAVAAAWEA